MFEPPPRTGALRPGLTGAPAWLHRLLQTARGAALRSLSPVDALLGRLRTEEPRPPLWLRRHVGALRSYRSSAREMGEWINNLKLVRPGDTVLDAGCGTGVMAGELARLLGADGRYIGFDVNSAAIEWAARVFRPDPRFRFEVAAVGSPFGARTSRSVESYRFPVGAGEADLVLAKSLFTHLLESQARNYLRETRRALRPGRAAVLTAFLFAPESLTGRGLSPLFRFGDAAGNVRWKWKARPASAVAYERSFFTSMVEEAGLHVQWHCQGFWPGEAIRLTAQDILVLGH